MNYYAFHIGDYAVHTRHLSLLEDLAYRRLLDLYYTRERAIPAGTQSVCRLLGMRDCVAEVEAVLVEFFTLNDDGEWVHARCEDEIVKARAAADRARNNGKAGGRPAGSKRQPKANPEVTQQDISGGPAESKSEAPNPNPNPNPNPKEEKEEKEKKPPATPWLTLSEVMADGLSEEVAAAWIAHRRAKKAKLTALAWSGLKAEVVKAGWELEAAVLKAIARNWSTFEERWVRDDRGGSIQSGQKPPRPKTFAERDSENRRARIREMTGGLMGGEPEKNFDFIDMESTNGKLLG
jgi:uncharacterized protein YdaU (DUF1376 family)